MRVSVWVPLTVLLRLPLRALLRVLGFRFSEWRFSADMLFRALEVRVQGVVCSIFPNLGFRGLGL